MALVTLAAVGFLHPGIAVIATACGLIPILVHLLNRRRYVRVPWAAMSFLMAARRRSARRVWIEQLLLLLTRSALIVLLGLALARPFVPASSRLGLKSSGVHRVILLDNSLSMQARTDDGSTRFERAKAYVSRFIPGSDSSDAISLITLASPAEALIEEVHRDAPYNFRFVRERLSSMKATQRGTDVVGALRLAGDILDSSDFPPSNRTIFLVSDFPKEAWESESKQHQSAAAQALAQLSKMVGDPTADIQLALVEPAVLENVSVTRLQIADPSRDRQGVPSLVGVGFPVRITAEIVNHGTETARNRVLQFKLKRAGGVDGKIIRRQTIPSIEPGSTQSIVLTTVFSEPGVHLVEAELIADTNSDKDRLSQDDVRYLSVEVRPSIPILLADGRPGSTRLQGQAGFLATALSPRSGPVGARGSSPLRGPSAGKRFASLIHPKVLTAPEIAAEVLTDYAAVFLCNVRRLPEQTWRQLEEYVANGGGLAVFCGDQVSVEHYNRHGFDGGHGLIPGILSDGRTGARITKDGGDSNNGGGPRVDLGFSLTDPVHPLVAEFQGYPESGLFVARVDRYLPIELGADKGDIVLSYTNDDAALVSSNFGEGRVLLWTTTANMEWTNLPAKGDFVSIVASSVAFLAPPAGRHRNVLAGETIRESLTAAQTSLPTRVLTVGDHVPSKQPELVPVGDSLALSYGPLEEAGSIELSIGADTRVFAVNVDSVESSLAGVDASKLGTLLGPRYAIHAVGSMDSIGQHDSGMNPRSTELSSIAVYLVILLLLVEMAMAMRFGAQRSSRQRPVSTTRSEQRSRVAVEAG